MTLDKFQKAWKAEAAQVRLSFDEELLTQRLKESHSDFQSMIRGRDTREIGMALVMIPIWIVMGLAFSLPWTWYLSIPALAWTAIFMWLTENAILKRVLMQANLFRSMSKNR